MLEGCTERDGQRGRCGATDRAVRKRRPSSRQRLAPQECARSPTGRGYARRRTKKEGPRTGEAAGSCASSIKHIRGPCSVTSDIENHFQFSVNPHLHRPERYRRTWRQQAGFGDLFLGRLAAVLCQDAQVPVRRRHRNRCVPSGAQQAVGEHRHRALAVGDARLTTSSTGLTSHLRSTAPGHPRGRRAAVRGWIRQPRRRWPSPAPGRTARGRRTSPGSPRRCAASDRSRRARAWSRASRRRSRPRALRRVPGSGT